MWPPPSSTLFPYTTLFRSNRYAEQVRDIFATGLIGGRDLFHFLRRSTSGSLWRYGLGELHIRRVLGLWTVRDRKSTRLNSSHQIISYAVFCLKKKKKNNNL